MLRLNPKEISKFELGYKKDKSARIKKYSGVIPISGGTKYWTTQRVDSYFKILHTIGYSSFIPAIRRSTDYRSAGPGQVSDRKIREKRETSSLPVYWDELSLSEHELIDSLNLPRRRKKKTSTSDKKTQKEKAEKEKANKEMARREALFGCEANLIEDSATIQALIELDYKGYQEGKPEFRNLIKKIGEISSEITEGFPIEFLRFGRDKEGFYPVFRTPDGEMPLNVLSQGTQSIFQWVAFLLLGLARYYNFPKNLEKKQGVLIIDEIDAHLHPSWQRRIIPTLIKHFPNLQIFCSTHSPLVVAGLSAGQVQLLSRDNKGGITVSRNNQDIAGWTADEILRTFMAVDDATDLETSENLSRLQELRQKKGLKADEKKELEKLRKILKGNISEFEIHDKLKSFL